MRSLKLTLIKLSSCGLLVCLLWRWWVKRFHNWYKTYTHTIQWALTANNNSERWATSKHACEIVCSSTCALWNACHLPTHHAWDGVPAQISARSSTVQLAAVSHGRWNALLAIPEGLLGRVEKWRRGNMATSPLIPHPRELWPPAEKTKIKIPFSLPKPAQQEDGVVEERWREGEQWSLFLSLQMGAFLTAQSFCSARIRGHCCTPRGCQTL